MEKNKKKLFQNKNENNVQNVQHSDFKENEEKKIKQKEKHPQPINEKSTENIDSNATHNMNTRSQDYYSVNFVVFISPEFDINPKNCEIGIYSDYNGWSQKDMTNLKIIT